MKNDGHGRKPQQPSGAEKTAPVKTPLDSISELADLLDQYMVELRAGRSPDRARLIAAHPTLAPHLEEALAGLEFIHGTKAGAAETPAKLGDFSIVREVGRGGMGVVYEAEQISLKRRVALKVLRVGAAVDEVALQRFQREAETVAHLHHTNIVPIFAVGCEEGVRYYAMQFIEGRNLAELNEEARAEAPGNSAAEVARWGLEAAEALAHAHERGVIHRDIKPSNLILDRDGRIWLTDFGLARRLEDATLSLAGALLGTPRYMSPEQASAAKTPVDHRTDIYSLGATLYELATRCPIFEAATAHAFLSQILHSEPIAPRRLVPDLPRDLETIILKCLAKDPTRRYASAQALAEDLRAFQEGRAIKARRPSLPEQALRWARKNRRSTTVAAVSAAASVVVLALALGGWRTYRHAQLGELKLTTKEPMLQAEVLKPGQPEPVLPAFSLPTKQPVSLPAGSYQVRLSTEGRLSETLQLQVDRTRGQHLEVALDNREFFEPFPVAMVDSVELVDLDGSADFVSARSWEVRRIDAATGNEIWKAGLKPEEGRAWWQNDAQSHGWSQFFSRQKKGPRLAQPAPDLNGDGIGDLVWASEANPTLLALSGRTGEVLWWHIARWPAEATNLHPDQIFQQWPSDEACVPVVADVDHDGTPDVIATFSARDWHWVEAVSGQTGGTLWQHTLDSRWFKAPSASNQKITPMPQLARVNNDRVVVLAASLRLVVLSLQTGATLWEEELPQVTLQEPRIADLDGDGGDDVLLLTDWGNRSSSLVAFSLAAKERLWEQPIAAAFEPYIEEPEQLDWPTVGDLDHDGRFEIVVPAGYAGLPKAEAGTESQWSGLDVLNGRDGSRRFRRALQRAPYQMPAQVNRFIIGPDIDGDGVAEILAASSMRPSPRRNDSWLYVDALSGQDGHSLWWWRTPLENWNDGAGLLALWQEGPDGFPLVVVSVVTWPKKAGGIYVLEGGSGELLHQISRAFAPQVADADGDGLPDLCYRLAESPDIRHGSGRLAMLRGKAPTLWARLNHPVGNQTAFPDIDGDGVEDVLEGNPVQALSGATGQTLWQSQQAARHFRPLPLPEGDLDGDGVPDVLAIQSSAGGGGSVFFEPITAISGKTGRELWKAALKSQRLGELHLAECVDLDGQGPAEVVVLMGIGLDKPPTADFGATQPSNRLWLAVFSARDGSLAWKQPLSGPYLAGDSDRLLTPAIADLDGDGVRDIVVGALTPTNTWEIRTFSGADGRERWRQPLLGQESEPLYRWFPKRPEPLLGDLDGDGVPEVVVVDYTRSARPGENKDGFECVLLALDGRTGAKKWAWSWTETSEDRRVLPLLVNFHGGRAREVCLLTGQFDRSEIVLLDARGQVTERLRIKTHLWPSQMWSADLDGDGLDELLYLPSDGQLHAVRRGLEQVLWRQPVNEVLGIRKVTGEPTTVIVQRGSDMVGLAGATGNALWRGALPSPRPGGPVLVQSGHEGEGLRSVANGPGSLVCRKVLPTLPTGQYRPATEHKASLIVPRRDPRLVRLLPWNFLEGPAGAGAPFGWFRALGMRVLLECGVLALLVALPAWLAWWVWRKWSWKAGLAATGGAVVVAGFLVGSVTGGWGHLALNLTFRPLLGLPQWIFLGACLAALWQRRWRRFGWLLSAALAVSALVAAVCLALDALAKPPVEYYSGRGWFFVLLIGGYLVGLLLALVGLWRAASARFRRASEATLSAAAA